MRLDEFEMSFGLLAFRAKWNIFLPRSYLVLKGMYSPVLLVASALLSLKLVLIPSDYMVDAELGWKVLYDMT